MALSLSSTASRGTSAVWKHHRSFMLNPSILSRSGLLHGFRTPVLSLASPAFVRSFVSEAELANLTPKEADALRISRGIPLEGPKALKRLRPTSPGQRGTVLIDRTHLWKGRPVRSLTEGLRKTGGRSDGTIRSRHRGGGHKKRYRFIDFRREFHDQIGFVKRFEYDPNRSAHIALIHYPRSDQLSYIIAPQDLKHGDIVESSRTRGLDIKPGFAMPLRFMPIGTVVHMLEVIPGKGAQIARAAGTFAQVIEKDPENKRGYALVRLSSKEVRYVLLDCMATVGVVSNPLHKLKKLGKAGRARWMGRRPKVRGVAMNPVDHPHGGRENKGRPGRPSVSYSGILAKGYRTRKRPRNPLVIVPVGGGSGSAGK